MKDDTLIERFIRRLKKIGVTVELAGNFPWVYLDTVNGKEVHETYAAEHGFTAFFLPVTTDRKTVWSDRRAVFNKIRDML